MSIKEAGVGSALPAMPKRLRATALALHVGFVTIVFATESTACVKIPLF